MSDGARGARKGPAKFVDRERSAIHSALAVSWRPAKDPSDRSPLHRKNKELRKWLISPLTLFGLRMQVGQLALGSGCVGRRASLRQEGTLKEQRNHNRYYRATEIRHPVGALDSAEDAARFNATFHGRSTRASHAHPGPRRHGSERQARVSGRRERAGNGNLATRCRLGPECRQTESSRSAFSIGNHAVGLNNNPKYGEGKGYSPFTEAQKAAARDAIHNWDDLIAAKFVEVKQGPRR